MTILLAIIFTALQYIEYSEASFTMADGIFGTTFFAATGLHGLHVIVGTIFLMVGVIRMINYQLTTNHHAGFEAGILYWHGKTLKQGLKINCAYRPKLRGHPKAFNTKQLRIKTSKLRPI